mmetsp:Transcript_12521/g.34527  ORF Transcript_12521/g.34527 Transcript_12521/m.34527 type:complete len:265 (-) Transcript_12521:510-1304(-)
MLTSVMAAPLAFWTALGHVKCRKKRMMGGPRMPHNPPRKPLANPMDKAQSFKPSRGARYSPEGSLSTCAVFASSSAACLESPEFSFDEPLAELLRDCLELSRITDPRNPRSPLKPGGSMKATMAVMSSTRSSISNQRRHAASTSAEQASRGSVCWSTTLQHIKFDRYCVTPSLATIRTRSLSLRMSSLNSGSATTPSGVASESPIDLVNAVPGYFSPSFQTRGAAPSPSFHSSWSGSTPSNWPGVRTTAPHFLTRSLSSRLKGV